MKPDAGWAAWWCAAEVVVSESRAKAKGQGCKGVLRDLKECFHAGMCLEATW